MSVHQFGHFCTCDACVDHRMKMRTDLVMSGLAEKANMSGLTPQQTFAAKLKREAQTIQENLDNLGSGLFISPTELVACQNRDRAHLSGQIKKLIVGLSYLAGEHPEYDWGAVVFHPEKPKEQAPEVQAATYTQGTQAIQAIQVWLDDQCLVKKDREHVEGQLIVLRQILESGR